MSQKWTFRECHNLGQEERISVLRRIDSHPQTANKKGTRTLSSGRKALFQEKNL